jgi:TatD DNase family protein
MPRIIDTHAHVQFPAYDEDREAVIKRALNNGVWMVNVGTQESTSESAIALAKEYAEGMYATIGFHPGHIEPAHHDEWEKHQPSEEVFNREVFWRLAEDPTVVAIGECGLDYYRLPGDAETKDRIKKKQKEVFEAQIDIAKKSKKPLIIHCREAFSDLEEILEKHFTQNSEPNGIVHFFSGTPEDIEILSKRGFYFGFGGVVTFAKAYRELIEAVPMERIVVETDAPYVAPVPYRGKRNESLYIEATVAKIAEWKDIVVEDAAYITTENAKRVLGLK